MTKTTISIGASDDRGWDAVAANFGFKGLTGIDYRKVQDALIAYINAGGGIAGRKVIPVYHVRNVYSAETFAAQAQETCAFFSEDHPVFAVLGTGSHDPQAQAACLNDRGIPMLNAESPKVGDGPFFDRYPHWYTESLMNFDRGARAWIDGLARQGYLGRGKYGIVYHDYHKAALDRSMKPALARYGIKFTAEAEIPFPEDVAGLGAAAAQIQNVVLRFKTEGIDHVLIWENGATISLFFMNQADSQQYRPRYGLGSFTHLEAMNLNAPEGQLHGALATGWRPHSDLTDQKPLNAQTKLCYDIVAKAGQPLPDTGARHLALSLCDMWFFLKAAGDRATDLTANGLRAAVEGLGNGWVSPTTHRAEFAPGRTHDGASATRGVRYEDGCRCWVPNGAITALRY